MSQLDNMIYDEHDYSAIKAAHLLREDAGEGVFFARSLESVKAQAYNVKRPELSAMRLFPVTTSTPAGATRITYRMFDSVGAAKIIANYAEDLPRADVGGQEFSSPIRGIGISYGYNVQEIRTAQFTGTPLESMRMRAAQNGHEQTINKLAWTGDPISGLPGFLTNPNLPIFVVPATGTGASKLFSTKTGDQIVDDLNAITQDPASATKGVHNVTEIWMSARRYAYIGSKRLGTETNMTVRQFFLDNNPGVTIIPVVELEGAGAGGTDVMIALQNNAENFEMEVPMLFMQHAPQVRNLEFVVPCESRFGGVIVRFPMAFAVGEGI